VHAASQAAAVYFAHLHAIQALAINLNRSSAASAAEAALGA